MLHNVNPKWKLETVWWDIIPVGRMVYRRSTLKVLLGPEGKTQIMDINGGEEQDIPRGRINNLGLEKIGFYNLYKRTRPPKILQARPRLDEQHKKLRLAGQRVQTEDTMVKPLTDESDGGDKPKKPESGGRVPRLRPAKSLRSAPTPLDSPRPDRDAGGYSPTFHKPTPASKPPEHRAMSGYRVSDTFLNDFGLKSIRADTFVGYMNRQSMPDIEKQMEEKATRHIRACQAIGDVKRNSLANRSYNGLKDAVAPVRQMSGHYLQDGLSRNLVRESSVFRPDSNRSEYLVQLRRPVGSITRQRNVSGFSKSNNPLPMISCRTVVLGSFDGM